MITKQLKHGIALILGIISIFTFSLIITSGTAYAQCCSNHGSHGSHGGHNSSEHEEHANDNNTTDNPIIREGVIDLNKIDENKDGYVYQDMMDWNVISDKPGNCPLCKMELFKVTLSQAAENLKEHDFKIKELK